ncbi:MAG: helix-turn-helix domain-containing protein [Lachnoclostridium sp.]|nr:helix-turn-helix domain-containing protein [Lachnospira sp.]MCM1248434.1 helix-turn-helix domain-containing protein [Lachnoclostridium sp.]MCM1536340.1 helix-turn-helix domain-containing protein [Clostridium sp.]
MKRAGISFDEMKADMLKDEDFKIEYEKLKPRYEAIEQIIKARKEQNMTQAELAKRVGTQKSNISRLESGNYNPSLDFLMKVAESLGKNLSVQIK